MEYNNNSNVDLQATASASHSTNHHQPPSTQPELTALSAQVQSLQSLLYRTLAAQKQQSSRKRQSHPHSYHQQQQQQRHRQPPHPHSHPHPQAPIQTATPFQFSQQQQQQQQQQTDIDFQNLLNRMSSSEMNKGIEHVDGEFSKEKDREIRGTAAHWKWYSNSFYCLIRSSFVQ